MKKTITAFLVIFSMFFSVIAIASAEDWVCAQCGNAASGNFCNNCGLSAAESEKIANNESIILLGHPVVIEDVCEFVIDEFSFTDRVDPENPAMAYSYYEADEGKTYFYIKVAYTNLEANTVSMQGFALNDNLVCGELIYADRYKYTGFLCYEEDLMGLGGSLTSAIMGSIDPLCTETMFYLIEVPDTVYESTESVNLILKVAGNEYELVVR